ncbi:TetR/AcrR family transcriptional regulator [Dictyobacter aurantiacus]|uniref:TetR family transcriptional regulator n=1 Tax=Dictyobacter aurantiacus TaxID=1936993 RepID=A0A401ZKF1_9CHLR|nr:TetR/AcrR family transcriptional regulator [Dictyobacter aurantiacus]GCE07329.1 TetR family transcriptional regulator [Dictyobacter aurantiacus]
MVRTVKEQEYTQRRSAILDMVQQLIYRQGYEQMTIQDVVDELKISKGAFYHYFASKQDVLEALLERMIDEAERLLIPIVQDPALPILVKFQRFFDAINRYKTDQKTLLLEIVRVWYADDNIIVRHKSRAIGIRRMAPLFSALIRQGIEEGIMSTPYSEQMSEVVLSLAASLSDTLGELLLAFDAERGDMARVEATIAAYTNALERVLGMSPNSFTLTDTETLKAWFVSAPTNAGQHSS